MIRLPHLALLDEMREVTHRRHEAIGEGRHVAHACFVRGVGHALRVGVIQGQRLLGKHMLARRDGRVRDGRMRHIRRRDDHRLYIIALHDLLVAGGRDAHTGLLAGLIKRPGIVVAERGDLNVLAER